MTKVQGGLGVVALIISGLLKFGTLNCKFSAMLLSEATFWLSLFSLGPSFTKSINPSDNMASPA